MIKAILGYNDLLTQNPELASEWHPTKNGELTPDSVTIHSGEKVWWLGKCGHEWKAVIANRSKGVGCPICNQEKQTSFAEQAIFFYLKHVFPDAVNRDKSFGKELDIYIPSIRVAVEYDGSYYHKNITKDKKKNDWCQKHDISLIRIREKDCPIIDGCETIIRNGNDDKSLEDAITALMKLLNIHDISIDIDRDRNNIYNAYIILQKEQSLLTINPELATEWHSQRNGNLTPDMVTVSSGKIVWWKCSKRHEWQASIANRSKGKDCPYCSGRYAIKGKTDLATSNHELTKEWHPANNVDITPNMITANSNKKVWWKCEKGHEWQTTIVSRSQGHGCPYCSGRYAIKGETDLATINPELAKEWHPTKNGDLTPDMLTVGSGKKVWWQCKEGHDWQDSVNNRNSGCGCPYCSNHRVLKGYNDLATENPELSKEWHPTKNGDLTPDMVTARNNKNVWWQCPEGHEWQATIASRSKGSGCPYCSGRYAIKGVTDLATKNLKLSSEWHPTKNGDLTPDIVTVGSNKKVWWKCTKGHEWQSTIAHRSKGSGCPYCSGQRVLKGVNDLATINPTLAKEWHPTKNGVLRPDMVMPGSDKKAWWQCSEGHEWQATISNRNKGRGCPYCARIKRKKT